MDVELVYLVVFILAVVLLFVVVGCYLNKLFKRSGAEAELTVQERQFYGVLCQLCANRAIVIYNIRLTEIPCFKTRYSKWSGIYRTLNAQQFDFVICRSKDYQPIAVIEFENDTRSCAEKVTPSDKVINVCRKLDVSMHRFSSSSINDLANVEALLFPGQPARFKRLDSGLQLPLKRQGSDVDSLEPSN